MDQSDYITAINEQTEVMRSLVREVKALRLDLQRSSRKTGKEVSRAVQHAAVTAKRVRG